MNEIIITTSKNELGTSKLGKATAFIITSLNTDINNEKERAIKVHDVDANEWATKSNVLGEFESTAKWAEKFFGWDKSKVSRYVRIVDKFHDDRKRKTDGNGVDIWDSYTVSQMIELLKATDEQLQSITADMSVRTIRDKLKMIDADSNDEQENENDEQENESNDEQDNADEQENESGDAIDVAPTYNEYKRTTDITELAATIRQFKAVNVEYDNGEYIIYTKASE